MSYLMLLLLGMIAVSNTVFVLLLIFMAWRGWDDR